MKTNINQIDNSSLGELLTAYYNNGMTSAEKSTLEFQAESDPFLADAMEGFNTFPEALNHIPKFNTKKNNKGWLVTGGIALLAVAGSLIYINSNESITQPNEVSEIMVVENERKTTVEIKEEPKTVNEKQESINISQIPKVSSDNKKEVDTKETSEPVIIEERQNIILPKLELTPKEFQEKQDDHARKARTKSIAFHGFIAVDYSLIYLNKIPVETRFSGTDASKSDKNDASIIPDNSVSTTQYRYKDYLKKTCKLMRDKKFTLAISNFNTMLTHFPNDVNAEFYLGYCYYELGNYTKAISNFDLAMNNGFDFFVDDSQWFKANSLENLGKFKEAQKIYRDIKKSGGYYSNRIR